MNAFLKTRRAAPLLVSLPLFFAGCTPQPPAENAVNSATPPASTRTSPAPSATPNKVSVYLFVPDENGKLKGVLAKADDYSSPPIYDVHYYGKMAEQLVSLLIQKSPRDFPKGARALDASKFQTDKEIIAVNFNKAFADPNFWQGETQTRVTIYAIVNTVVQYGILETHSVGEKTPGRVRFLIEGKPIQTLGEFDVSDPLAPDMTLVAKP